LSLLTPAQFREHQATELGDVALQRLIDAAELAITRRYGSLAAFTELRRGGGSLLFLSRASASITTIVERVGDPLGQADVTLAPADYTVLPGGLTLRREYTGPHPRAGWQWDVVVTYTPLDDSADRIRATIALVKLDINNNPGLTAESVGDWSQTYADNSAMNYGRERETILSSLEAGLGFA